MQFRWGRSSLLRRPRHSGQSPHRQIEKLAHKLIRLVDVDLYIPVLLSDANTVPDSLEVGFIAGRLQTAEPNQSLQSSFEILGVLFRLRCSGAHGGEAHP